MPTTRKLYDNLITILCINTTILELKQHIKDAIIHQNTIHNSKGTKTVHPYNDKTDKGRIIIFKADNILEEELVFGTTNTVIRISVTKQPLSYLGNCCYLQLEISEHFIKEIWNTKNAIEDLTLNNWHLDYQHK
ncbi:hypothetical protein RCL_jg24008.t1 [Rhizophagus clarus]|uniref:Uncharacterized protein n=1 Tax=Rhizophagus clarus TaxID=94130 RepID=A0A8H3QR00_9GLOM|nr:hypothetical protein RCL_jg24008.t1 [Rhizophagus clarus]